jgi:hypothetical protein
MDIQEPTPKACEAFEPLRQSTQAHAESWIDPATLTDAEARGEACLTCGFSEPEHRDWTPVGVFNPLPK